MDDTGHNAAGNHEEKAMKTAKKIAKIEQSIRLQERTLANLHGFDQVDGGQAIQLTEQLLTIMRANLAGLVRVAGGQQLNADMGVILRDAEALKA